MWVRNPSGRRAAIVFNVSAQMRDISLSVLCDDLHRLFIDVRVVKASRIAASKEEQFAFFNVV